MCIRDSRLTGSSDLYAHSGRRPYASVNFVTAHDGFTLQDLVSYNEKHNEANGENNRDGNNDNRSWNCGAEGPTDDANIQALRAKQKRNFIATLLLSQGVPMMYAGDAIGHTQMGNNNAYSQDNQISWLGWVLQPEDRNLLAFVQRMINFRKRHPVFRRRRFFQGRPIKGCLLYTSLAVVAKDRHHSQHTRRLEVPRDSRVVARKIGVAVHHKETLA